MEAGEKLAKIIDNLTIPAFAINSEHKITHWNRAVESLTGLKREEVVGTDKQWMAFYPNKRPVLADLIVDEASEREIKDKYGDKYKKSSLSKGAYEVLDFFPALGEGGKWLEFSAVPVRDNAGDVISALETLKDVTDRVRVVNELKESEEKYRAFFKTSRDCVFITSKDGRLIDINDAGVELFGYENRDDLLTVSVPELYENPEERKRHAQVIEQQGFSKDFAVNLRRKDGSIINTLITSVVREDENGNVIGYQGAIRDITERKKAEEKYRSLVESTEDSVYLLDRDCRYLFVNEKHLSRLGFVMDDLRGRRYGELHPEDETKELAEKVEEAFETGNSVQQEHRSHRDVRYFLRTLSPVKDSDGRTTAVTVVSKDITGLKYLEKELRAKNEELERFTYTVSHDLRSPLVTIKGFTGMLREDLERKEEEKVETDLKYIEAAATKMDRLLNSTLELSRIGRVANPPEDVPFGEIVKEALELTSAEIKSSGVEVTVADDFPPVHVDRMKIEELLVNLIVNSINYRGEQPHPKIEIGYRVDGESEETVFFVKDNGIGIDPNQHEKVFDLFYQIEGNNKGTGAGLAIVKRIIEVHNGRVWIESEKGKGCTVCFTLPVVQVRERQSRSIYLQWK